MGKGNIKGITIEIGGDTTGLQKALDGVDKNIRSTQAQLKDVNRLLKLDPTNVELLQQKQDLLQEAIAGTAERLDTLKKAQKQAKQQFENGELGKDKYNALKREVIETEAQLNNLNKQNFQFTEAGRQAAQIAQQEAEAQARLAQEQEEAAKAKEQAKQRTEELAEATETAQAKLELEQATLARQRSELKNNTNAFNENKMKKEELKATEASLTQQIQLQKQKVNALQVEVDNLTKSEEENEQAIIKKQTELQNAITELNNYQSELDETQEALSGWNKVSESTGKAGEAMESVGKKMTVVTGAVVAGGVTSIKTFDDLKIALNQLESSTGASEKEMEKYRAVLEEVYKNNYGEGYEDIANAMSQVRQQMGDLDNQTLQNVTESAIALRDTFEYEVGESTRAAQALMKNFGISADEAFNLIASGAQNGLDYSGELIDSINEYSVQFAKVGLDANDMFNIFQEGAANGAFNLDKIGDAIKEFSIRAIDGSDTTKEGFKAIGLSASDMAKKFSAGGETAKLAFKETLDGLAKMKNPVDQNTAAVNLFGTMWEDLGPKAVLALGQVKDTAYGTGQELDKIKETRMDSLSSQLSAIGRTITNDIAIPLGEALMPIVQSVVEKIRGFVQVFTSLSPEAQKMIATIALIVAAIGPLLIIIGKVSTGISAITGLMAKLGGLTGIFSSLTSSAGGLGAAFAGISAPVLAVVAAIGALVAIFATLWNTNQNFKTNVLALWNQIKSGISQILDSLKVVFQAFVQLVNALWNAFGDDIMKVAKIALEGTLNVIKSVLQVIQGVIKTVTSVIKGDWSGAWEGIKMIASGVINAIKSIINTGLNLYRTIITSVLSKIQSVWTSGWNKVKSIASSLLASIGAKIKSAFQGFVNSINEKLRGAVNAVRSGFKGVVNYFTNLGKEALTWGKQIVNGLINGITSKVGEMGSAVRNFCNGVVNKFLTAFDINSPSRVMKEEVGVYIALGVIEGINSKKGIAKKTASEYSELVMSAAEKRLDKYKTYHDMSLKDEVAYWNKIRKATKKGTDAQLSADKKYFEAKANYQAAIVSNAQETLDNYKGWHNLTAKEEMDYWNEVRQLAKKGTSERLELDKKYIEAKKSYNEQVKTLNSQYKADVKAVNDELKQNIKELNQAYKDAVTERTNAILSTFKLFEEYEQKEAVTSDSLTLALTTQVNALKTWRTQLADLKKRNILPQGLVDEISDMGVDATVQIQALNSMTDTELQNYVLLWKQKNALAKQEAVKELAPMKQETEAQIQALKKAANKELKSLESTYKSNLQSLGSTAYSSAKSAGKKTVKGIVDGIESMMSTLTKSLDGVSTKIQAAYSGTKDSTASKASKNTASAKKKSSVSVVTRNVDVSGVEKGINNLAKAVTNQKIVLDTGVVAGAITPTVNKNLATAGRRGLRQ